MKMGRVEPFLRDSKHLFSLCSVVKLRPCPKAGAGPRKHWAGGRDSVDAQTTNTSTAIVLVGSGLIMLLSVNDSWQLECKVDISLRGVRCQ